MDSALEQEFIKLSGWSEPRSVFYNFQGVLFSATKKGDALMVHVACDKRNMRNLRLGCSEFIKSMFSTYEWCKMIIATVNVKNKSVYNLCKKLGFIHTCTIELSDCCANVMVVKK